MNSIQPVDLNFAYSPERARILNEVWGQEVLNGEERDNGASEFLALRAKFGTNNDLSAAALTWFAVPSDGGLNGNYVGMPHRQFAPLAHSVRHQRHHMLENVMGRPY